MVSTYDDVTCNVGRWNNGGNDDKKGQEKLKGFEKIVLWINYG